MKDPEEIKKTVLELIETSRAAYLSTVSENGYPYIRALLNMRSREQYPDQTGLFEGHQNDFMLLFSTNTSSGKIAQVKANPKVSAYFCKPDIFHGAMLAGDIEIVDDPKIKHALWNEGWEKYYPSGRDDPDYTVLRLFPKIVRGWLGWGTFEFKV